MLLAYNEALLHLANQIALNEPDMKRVSERLKVHPKLEQVINDDEALFSLFSEVHLRVVLEDICAENRLNGMVKFDPILDGTHTKNYFFRTCQGSLEALKKKTWDVNSEYDSLLTVDGLPSIFEVKLSKTSLKYSEIKKAFSEEYIRRVTTPIKEYFGRDCSLVLVTYGSFIKPAIHPEQIEFWKNGGVIVPVNLGYHSFKGRYNLPLCEWEKREVVSKTKQELGT